MSDKLQFVAGATPLFTRQTEVCRTFTSPDRSHLNKTVDNEAGAKRLGDLHATRRGVQLLRAHIQNKSEQNGKKAAATARLLFDRTSRVKSK